MQTELTKKNTLIAVAMKEELSLEQAEGWNVIYTGIGKVNALISVNRALKEFNPDNLINFGTAGSSRSDLKGLHEVTTFKQRDMDLRSLGLPLGVTLNDHINDIYLDRPGLSCGTGDSFVMAPDPWFVTSDIDCVDMEGWALAYVAQQYDIPFRAWKYVSDMADENAMEDWTTNVAAGAELFLKTAKNLGP